jgi:hypothetical protein
MNVRKAAVIVGMDFFLLSDLVCAIYLGHRQPETFVETFLKVFVPTAVAVVLIARWMLRRLESDNPQGNSSERGSKGLDH